jgi:hypothetical protein
MKRLRSVAMWCVMHVPLGPLLPHVLAFALGASSYRELKDDHNG